MANQTILNLNKMCVSAGKAVLGTKLDTLVADLKEGKTYSGDLLTDEQVALLNKMCSPAKEVALGTVIDNTLKASKLDTSVTKLTDDEAENLNKMCITSTKVVEGENVGLGTLLQWCADTINAGAGGEKHNLTVNYDAEKITLSIKKNGVEVTPGIGVLNNNDSIVITATGKEGFEVTELTVNDVPVTSGSTYTVTSNINVAAVAQPTYALTITANNATVTVTADGETIDSGDEVYDSEIITISATPADTYTSVDLKVNGQDFLSGAEYTVVGPVAITAEGKTE